MTNRTSLLASAPWLAHHWPALGLPVEQHASLAPLLDDLVHWLSANLQAMGWAIDDPDDWNLHLATYVDRAVALHSDVDCGHLANFASAATEALSAGQAAVDALATTWNALWWRSTRSMIPTDCCADSPDERCFAPHIAAAIARAEAFIKACGPSLYADEPDGWVSLIEGALRRAANEDVVLRALTAPETVVIEAYLRQLWRESVGAAEAILREAAR